MVFNKSIVKNTLPRDLKDRKSCSHIIINHIVLVENV